LKRRALSPVDECSDREWPRSRGLIVDPAPRRKILRLRFGLDGQRQRHWRRRKDFHVSKERIRQIEKKALRKLKNPNRQAFQDFYRVEEKSTGGNGPPNTRSYPEGHFRRVNSRLFVVRPTSVRLVCGYRQEAANSPSNGKKAHEVEINAIRIGKFAQTAAPIPAMRRQIRRTFDTVPTLPGTSSWA